LIVKELKCQIIKFNIYILYIMSNNQIEISQQTIKDYIKTTNDNLNLIKNKAGDNQTTLEILVQNGDNIIQDDLLDNNRVLEYLYGVKDLISVIDFDMKDDYLKNISEMTNKILDSMNTGGRFNKNIKLSEYQMKKGKKTVASYTLTIFMILMILILIFFAGLIKKDIYPFLLFLFFMCFPLLVLYRNNLTHLVPGFLKSTVDIDASELQNLNTRNLRFGSQLVRDILKILASILLTIMALFMIMDPKTEKSFFKIIICVICACQASVIIGELPKR